MGKKSFEEKFTQLNQEYQLLLVRRDMIDKAVKDKETEIQALLDAEAGIKIP